MKTKTHSLKTPAIILSLLMIFTVFSGFSEITVASAQSTATITLSNIGDLMSIANAPGNTYVLANDIDASDTDLNIPSFSGKLDGRGYEIKLNTSSLFGTIESGAVVQDLAVTTDNTVSGETNVGLLAGISKGSIIRCAAFGKTNATSVCGGLVGLVSGGSVSNCYSMGYVSASAGTAGGLIGKTEDAVIENCYSAALISDSSIEMGGLIGGNTNSQIKNCYASSNISSQPLGVGMGSDTVTNINDMTNPSSFTGFDFGAGATWIIPGDSTSPRLVSISGAGTSNNPYRIHFGHCKYANDLLELGAEGLGESGNDKHFILNSEIDGSQYLGTLGNNEQRFNGTFDGNGHIIQGISNPLFGAVGENGLVKNITLTGISVSGQDIFGLVTRINYGTIENCHADSCKIIGIKDLGGIAGENINGTIRRCSYNGAVSGSQTGLGGIAGYNSYGTISECSVKNGSVVSYDRSIGGIVGDNTSGLIENCMVYDADVQATNGEAGGIAGRLYNGTIKNCYANQTVSGGETKGAIAGVIIENGSIENCRYNSDKTEFVVSGSEDKSGALSGADLKDKSLFAGFDFSNVWTNDEDGDIALLAIKGSGTKQNPYIIRTSQDWFDADDGINSNGEKNYYVLANNLYTTYTQESFSGSLNGMGYTVFNENTRFIDNLTNGGYIGNTVFKNCGYIAKNIENSRLEYCSKIGYSAICDTIKDSTVNNCAVFSVSINNDIAGGFANNVSGSSTISDCYVCNAAVSGGNIVGGFVGNNSGGKISDCYVYGTTVSSSNIAGGFVGRNDNGAVLTRCYTNAEVSSDKYPGAFVGTNYAVINDTYADNSKITAFAAQDEGTVTDTKLSADGEVMPSKYIKTAGFDVSVNDTTVYTPPVTAPVQNGLTDIAGHWAEKTIQNLVGLGIVNGYEDNTYRPEDSVTKGEYIKLLMSVTSSGTSSNFTQYKDVNASWAKGYISRAIELGICDNINSEETVFGVDSPITRAEAASLMGRLLASDKSGTPSFSDTSEIPDWAINPVFASVELGLIAGNDDGSFKPLNNLTRAEAATIIERILNLE